MALRRDAVKLGKVHKALARLEVDPTYPGLRSSKYESLKGPNGEAAWHSYAENNVPAAYRIFWCYGPNPPDNSENVITVFWITQHP
jgi:hypothetical protein